MEIESIWIEAEEWASGWSIDDANSDVEVVLSDLSRWMGSFFTYSNVASLREKNSLTGECLSGGYLWANDMILIDVLERPRIDEVVRDLIRDGLFQSVFSFIGFKEYKDESAAEATIDGSHANDVDEGIRATALLGGKTVRRVVKRGETELLIEFEDGTRLFSNSTPSGMELSIN